MERKEKSLNMLCLLNAGITQECFQALHQGKNPSKNSSQDTPGFFQCLRTDFLMNQKEFIKKPHEKQQGEVAEGKSRLRFVEGLVGLSVLLLC